MHLSSDHDQLALVDEAEHSIIELSQFSQSLENGQSVFTGRGSYVLLSIDSKYRFTVSSILIEN